MMFKTVALVGESGSGKSAVISLLQRFDHPDSSHITPDGIKIGQILLYPLWFNVFLHNPPMVSKTIYNPLMVWIKVSK